MAEHDDKLFEQELAKMFAEMDSKIEIPEIPDVQTIFDRAETEKNISEVIPFKKYSRYIAVAAAVVLICVSVPAFANLFSYGGFNMYANDEAVQEPCEAPMIEAEAAEDYDAIAEIVTSDSSIHRDGEAETKDVNGAYDNIADNDMKYASQEEKINEAMSSSAASSSVASSSAAGDEKISLKSVLYGYFESIKSENPETGGSGYDDVQYIEEYINKKRSIDITVENGSVSVVVHDNAANEEIINAFWVEGNYEDSYLDGEYYIINLSKKIDKEELETDYYLPMAGDANGTYTISESSVSVAGEVRKGVISLTVSINVGTGEYEIYASLV